MIKEKCRLTQNLLSFLKFYNKRHKHLCKRLFSPPIPASPVSTSVFFGLCSAMLKTWECQYRHKSHQPYAPVKHHVYGDCMILLGVINNKSENKGGLFEKKWFMLASGLANTGRAVGDPEFSVRRPELLHGYFCN